MWSGTAVTAFEGVQDGVGIRGGGLGQVLRHRGSYPRGTRPRATAEGAGLQGVGHRRANLAGTAKFLHCNGHKPKISRTASTEFLWSKHADEACLGQCG
jgi:hypothetical protein